MKTTSVMLQTLCVPCQCRCRYCLLSWAGQTVGADYDRCERLAARFHDWIGQERPDLSFNFSFGYSMEHPRLFDALRFLNSIGSVTGEFLQCDGLRFRTDDEIETLLSGLGDCGVKHLNFTFYGTRDDHDRFAARKGDFDFMLRLLSRAAAHGFKTSAGMPLTRENAAQAGTLYESLAERGADRITPFVPHAEGRGALLDPIRLTQTDYDSLDTPVRQRLNRERYRTEAEWLALKDWNEPQRRSLLISLTPENIARYEDAPFDEIIAEVERLDEAYYAALPSYEALAARYGNPEGDCFYGRRDLFARYQKAFIREHRLALYDVTDERFSGSRRF